MSTFITIKAIVAAAFFILTTNFAKSGYLGENTKPLSLVKPNHSHRKYSRKKVLQVDIPEATVEPQLLLFVVREFSAWTIVNTEFLLTHDPLLTWIP